MVSGSDAGLRPMGDQATGGGEGALVVDRGRCKSSRLQPVLSRRHYRRRRALLTDRAHDARSWATLAYGALHLLQDSLVVRGNRGH